jgi:hypothetical protein
MHVAAVRVVHDIHHAPFHLDQDFDLNLGHTQYLLYYALGTLLAALVGVARANVALCAFYMGGTVLGTREVLRSLERDERLCLFSIPLLANTLFAFGFMPFLLGIPFMLFGVALTLRYRDKPSLSLGIALGVTAIATFYSHIFPFAVFGLAFALLFPWEMPHRWVKSALPVVPSLALLAWWVLLSPAGKESAGGLSKALHHAPLDEAIRQLPTWIWDIFQDTTDETIFLLFVALVVLSLGLSLGDSERSHPRARLLVLVPLACGLGYFLTGENLGPIWLFAQRFPILGLFMAVPLLRMPSGNRGVVITALATALGAHATVNTCRHFIDFQQEEVGDFDEALEGMAPGKRVAALIFDKSSRSMRWAPFLHFGSYYQAAKGGVIQFSCATQSHWPFHYKPGHLPPPGTPPRLRWEWTPEQVPVEGELFPYYDYVLTRGFGFHPPPGTFSLQWRGEHWAVWKRDDGQAVIQAPKTP